MKSDFTIIKTKFGEKMAQLCRSTFPTILEHEGLLSQIMLENFAPTHSLYQDLKEPRNFAAFKNFIFGLYQPTTHTIVNTKLSPEALMRRAGYTLYPECQTESDIQAFKKYYNKKHNEILCTFNGQRLDSCRVWFAVKDGAEKLNREDFQLPDRQDEYGTSVISIQFSKDQFGQVLSIKNRYNHTVRNPDSTFSNNLDNIIAGLTNAFDQYYGCRNLNARQEILGLPNYVAGHDGKYYRENFESNNTNFCENNVFIKHGHVFKIRTDANLLVENYLIDLKNNQVANIVDDAVITTKGNEFVCNFQHPYAQDGFTESLGKIKKIDVNKDHVNGGKIITFHPLDDGRPIILQTDQHARVVAYENLNVTEIKDYFLIYNRKLNYLKIPHCLAIGSNFLRRNEDLKQISLPQVREIGNSFLCYNSILTRLYLPHCRRLGRDFMAENTTLANLSLPSVAEIDDGFMPYNNKITQLNLPAVREIGEYFLYNNENINQITMPNVEVIGNRFLSNNEKLSTLDLPRLSVVGSLFLAENECLSQINLPELKNVGAYFLVNNKNLQQLYLPSATFIDNHCLNKNKKIEVLDLPNVEEIKGDFLANNHMLTPANLHLPKVKKIKEMFFLYSNSYRKEIIAQFNCPAPAVSLSRGQKLRRFISEHFQHLFGLNQTSQMDNQIRP